MPRVLCVFAHPDDESFGPGGTIAKLSEKNEVYILCATKGESGNGGGINNLGKIRVSELKKSATILGVKKIEFLGYHDGDLSNNLYHDIAGKIQKYIDNIKPQTLITFEPRGVSGHIDHIALSMITTFVFYESFCKELWYFCFSEAQRKHVKDYFIFFPPGYKKGEIDKTVDVSSVWSKKVTAIKCHKSQKKDVNFILTFLESYPKKEHFLVLKK